MADAEKSRLYTKRGDAGQTDLYDLRRVNKSEDIFDVLGDLDELSAHIGLMCSYSDIRPADEKFFRLIQSKLLDIGSDIATVSRRDYVVQITAQDVEQLEKQIDLYDSKSPKLTEFILTGVRPSDAQAHVARAVCRRLERNIWKLVQNDGRTVNIQHVQFDTMKWLNRLSDLLFAYGRYLSGGRETRRSQIKSD